jgi:hypothetical protein
MSEAEKCDAVGLRSADKHYCELSLVELAEAICREDDSEALRELHQSRTPFRNAEGTMRLVEYIDQLRLAELKKKNTSKGYDEIVNRAYDMTIDKFGNLPSAEEDTIEDEEAKHIGPDCRYYYRALLEAVQKEQERQHVTSAIEAEVVAANTLQKLVKRHFELSLKECQRRCYKTRTRYAWEVSGGTVTVWMPREMPGRDKRAWLEEHVEDPDPNRPGEKDRIQAIVDEHLPAKQLLPISSHLNPLCGAKEPEASDPSAGVERSGPVDLAVTVAEEKATKIEDQRRAIRHLGAETLKKLVIRIFDDLAHDDYNLTRVAEYFGLSKSTLSRFAGARWTVANQRSPGREMPDLWENTARVLASYPVFREVARESGVWPEAESALKNTADHKENE